MAHLFFSSVAFSSIVVILRRGPVENIYSAVMLVRCEDEQFLPDSPLITISLTPSPLLPATTSHLITTVTLIYIWTVYTPHLTAPHHHINPFLGLLNYLPIWETNIPQQTNVLITRLSLHRAQLSSSLSWWFFFSFLFTKFYGQSPELPFCGAFDDPGLILIIRTQREKSGWGLELSVWSVPQSWFLHVREILYVYEGRFQSIFSVAH